MKFSLFSNAFDEVPVVKDMSWETFAAKLGPHDYSHSVKEQTPCFSPAEYAPKAKRRADAAVVQLWMFVLDIDHATEEQVLDAMGVAEGNGLAAVVYSTWRHAEDPWRVRIVVPLSRPVATKDWPEFWARANRMFLGLCDPKCRNPSRIFFGPYAPAGTEDKNFFIVMEGKPLDVDELYESGEDVPVEALFTTSTEKLSRDRLEKFARTLSKKNDDFQADLGERLIKVVKGDVFADPGERDNMIFKLAAQLAQRYADFDPASIAALFSPSLKLMSTVSGCPTVDDVEYKIRRAQESQLVTTVNDDEKIRIRQAFRSARDYPYTQEELKAFGGDDMKKRWVLQYGNTFYLFVNGDYRAYGEGEVCSAAVLDLAPAKTAGITLFRTAKEEVVQKTKDKLVQEYGTVVSHVVADMRLQKAYFDERENTLCLAPCPRRPVQPVFHPAIDIWLRLVGGPQYLKLEGWLSWVTYLDNPCTVLFLVGPKSTGKTFLVRGLARLYTTKAPTKLEIVLANFNGDMQHCPIVLADEHLPSDNRGRARGADLREHAQALEHQLSQKFRSNTLLRGATRTVVCANNAEVLTASEDLSNEDISAMGERFTILEVQPEAAEYLSSLDPAELQTWLDEDKIAEHVLWLNENRRPPRHGRFLVHPDHVAFAELMAVKGTSPLLLSFNLRFLQDQERFHSDPLSNLQLRVKRGELLANVRGYHDCWHVFMPSERCPSLNKLTSTLREISTEPSAKKDARVKYQDKRGKFVKYRVIDKKQLIWWANRSGEMSEAQILRALSVDTKED